MAHRRSAWSLSSPSRPTGRNRLIGPLPPPSWGRAGKGGHRISMPHRTVSSPVLPSPTSDGSLGRVHSVEEHLHKVLAS